MVPQQLDVPTLVQSFVLQPGPKPSLNLDYCAATGILPSPGPASFYVEPDLTVEESGSENVVWLISAPAAVGKTRLAEEMHRRLSTDGRHVLYIPLHKAAIGDNYFAGLLSNTFPQHSQQEILNAVFSGRIILLFDGYDEVSMSSQQIEKNQRFASEIASCIRTQKACGGGLGPSIVFLFRSVFWHFGVFDSLRPFATRISVDFFAEEKRRIFLSGYLAGRGAATGGVRVVSSLLETFERQLAVAGKEAAAFFGHAIVLSAFGDFILEQDEDNVIKLANQLQEAVGRDTVAVKILRGVIDTIVGRETGKFPNGVFTEDLTDFDGYSGQLQHKLLETVAYARARDETVGVRLREQITKLASEALSAHPSFAALPRDKREQLQRAYVEELSAKIQHHPFLDMRTETELDLDFRNPIYREYYLASFLARNPQTRAMELRLTWSAASYYLAFFLLGHLQDRDLSNSAPDHLFLVLTLLTSASSEREPEFLMEWSSEGGWNICVDTDGLSVEPFRYSSELLSIELPHGGVIENFSINSPSGELRGMVSIRGPEGFDERQSQIRLRNAEIASEEVEFDAGAISFERVVIHADTLMFTDRVSRLDGVDSLELCSEHKRGLKASEFVRSNWSEGILAAPVFSEGSEGFRERLEQVLLWFRKHGRKDYGVYEKRFQTVVLRKNQSDAIGVFADFLFNEHLLVRKGELVVLEQDAIAEYGVYYVQQNKLSVDETKSKPLFDRWLQYVRRRSAEPPPACRFASAVGVQR